MTHPNPKEIAMSKTDDFQDRGEAARQAAGIDGTAGDAQDIPHGFVRDPESTCCLVCGLAPSYRKHTAASVVVEVPGV